MRPTPPRFILLCLLLTASCPTRAEPPARLDRHGDPLPEGAVARLGTVRFRHGQKVLAGSFSPDSKRLISYGEDEVIRTWDTETGRELDSNPRQGHPIQLITAIAFSDDGNWLAIAWVHDLLKQQRILIVDTRTGKELHQIVISDDEPIVFLTFSPNAKCLAAGSPSTAMYVWELPSGKTRKVVQLKPTQLIGLRFTADSQLLAVIRDNDDTIHIGEPLAGVTRQGIKLDVEQTKFEGRRPVLAGLSPDGRLLATYSRRDTVCLWDAKSGKLLHRFVAPRAADETGSSNLSCTALQFSSDGKFLAIQEPTRFRIWETSKGKLRWTATSEADHTIASSELFFSPDGKWLAALERSVRCWDLATGKEPARAPGHSESIKEVAFSPKGGIVATIASSDPVQCWRVTDGRRPSECENGRSPGFEANGIAFTSSGNSLIVSGWQSVQFFDPRNGKEQRRLQEDQLPLDPRRFAASPDGRELAVFDTQLEFFDVATGKKTSVHRLSDCDAIAYSPDGSQLRCARDYGFTVHVFGGSTLYTPNNGDKAYLQLWQMPIRDNKTLLSIETDRISSIGIAPNSRMLAYATFSKTRLIETATGDMRAQYETGRIFRFSPNGRFLAFGDDKSDVVLWDLTTRQEAHRFRGHRGPVTAVDFSADGKYLVSGSADTTALVWDLSAVPQRRPQAARQTAEHLESLWTTLQSTSAVDAYAAVCTLTSAPESTIAFLRSRLRPIVHDPRQVERWIVDLRSPKFSIRAAATTELEQLGLLAAPALRQALAAAKELEPRRRLEQLLASAERQVPPPTVIRLIRAVEVLENIGAPEAMKLLRDLSAGAKDARLTQEASAAVRRLVRTNR